jgi:hypothetical protein
MVLRKIQFFTLTLAFGLTNLFASEKWESLDGRFIMGDFVRMDESAVTLQAGEKEYKISRSNLSPKSIQKALEIDKIFSDKVSEIKDEFIINANELNKLIAYSPRKLEGKIMYVVGYVTDITQNESALTKLDKQKIKVTLSSGDSIILDFKKEIDNYSNKIFKRSALIEIRDNKAELVTKSNFMGRRSGPTTVGTLVSVSQKLIFKAIIKNGEVIFGDRVAEQDLERPLNNQNRLAALKLQNEAGLKHNEIHLEGDMISRIQSAKQQQEAETNMQMQHQRMQQEAEIKMQMEQQRMQQEAEMRMQMELQRMQQ